MKEIQKKVRVDEIFNRKILLKKNKCEQKFAPILSNSQIDINCNMVIS